MVARRLIDCVAVLTASVDSKSHLTVSDLPNFVLFCADPCDQQAGERERNGAERDRPQHPNPLRVVYSHVGYVG
jgi:hypothetical protein